RRRRARRRAAAPRARATRRAAAIADALAGPDFALTNARFVDYRGVVGDTLLVGNGRIVAVGTGLDVAASVPAIDLGGRTVVPGFVDAHVHYTRAGVNPGHQERRVERAFSIAELQQ